MRHLVTICSIILYAIILELANCKIKNELPKTISSDANLTTNDTIIIQKSNASKEFVHQIVPNAVNDSVSKRQRLKNYASMECAKVLETNPEAKKASHIINDMVDEYMLNPCKTKIWFVIELCEAIQATHIEIANYELFSSTPKDFSVYSSDTYPAVDWKPVGHFTASDSRTLQAFDLNQVGFGKFVRVEMHSHYGNEHYCPISEVKVYGASMLDEFDNQVDKTTTLELMEGHLKIKKKSKRKNSSYQVYYSMMTESPGCGLLRTTDKSDIVTGFPQKVALPINIPHLPQPTQQPVVNRTTPLKPSIFVELSNKVKALETTLKIQMDEMERRLSEKSETERRTEAKVDRVNLEFKSFALIVISYYVYKLMLDLM